MKTRKINVLFHAINGVGFGHIQRAKNIAAFLKGQDCIGQLHLASSSQGRFDIGPFDKFHHLSQHISKENHQQYEEQTYSELLKIALSNDIRVIFHDTYFLSPLVREDKFLHYYIYRLTSREHFIKSKRIFGHFSRIYVPHSKEEFESIIPREEYEEYEDKIVFLGYVSDENLQQEDITLNKKSKKILISPGYGGDQDQVKDFLEYSIKLISEFLEQSDESYSVDMYTGVHKEALLEQLEIPTDFTIHNFSSEYKSDFMHADIFIGRGGYNTVSEIISLQKKSLLYFADRFHESQQKRIEFFTDNFPFIVKSGKKIEHDIEKLLRLEQQEFSDKYTYVKATGEEIVNEILEIASRPNLCIFHSSYIQDSQTFIADEIEELSQYFNIYLITLSKDFETSYLYNKNIRVVFFEYSNQIYTYDTYPYPHLYNQDQKKVYVYFLRFFIDFLKDYKIDYVLGEFLGDTMYISIIKKFLPNIYLYSCARGNDIYNIYKHANQNQKIQLKHYIDGVFVRDSYMMDFALSEGFDEKKVHIIRSGKIFKRYMFSGKDFIKFQILIGGRIVEKKGILETLELLEELIKRKNIYIASITLLGENTGDEYSQKVFDKISNSKYLRTRIRCKGFIGRDSFLKQIHEYTNVFIGHFQKSKNGDTDGIPNMILENMLVGNIIFSTLAGGIVDILENKKTGFVLSGNIEKDVKLFEDIFLENSKKDLEKMCKNARNNIINNFNIESEVAKMKKLMEGNLE